MSWHYSRALVAEYLAENCLDGELFAPLKETDTPEAYCWRDKTTESLNLFQYGTTCGRSTEDPGAALLTWFLGASLARTLALPELCGDATAWKVNDPVYGARTCGLLGRFDLPLFLVKTARHCERADWIKSSEDLPRSGMFQNGQYSELIVLDCITNATGFGSSLPTPTARDYKDTFGMSTTRSDGKTRLDRLPMLLFSLVRSAGLSSTMLRGLTDAKIVTVKDRVQVMISGLDYCPELPEWVMGWPIGWTDLKPLETDRFQQWLLSHGKFFPEE